MAFIKEYITSEDIDFLNTLEIYNYHQKNIKCWNEKNIWMVDREKEIYFIYVGGSMNLEQDPQQYELIWKGKKVVIFQDNYSHDNKWILSGIYAPVEFEPMEEQLLDVIRMVLNEYYRIRFWRSETTYKTDELIVNNIEVTYKKEVK